MRREPKDLDNFPQWREEVGYWLGEYSLYGKDGKPYTSSKWNYPYDQYKGFITGNISGYVPFFSIMNDNLYLSIGILIACHIINIFISSSHSGSYRQRNIFVYPPQAAAVCSTDNSVVGDGTCGENGNTKLFEADQSGSSCDGSIEGPFNSTGITTNTSTTLVGADNAVLYQAYLPDSMGGGLIQSQLTTLSGENRRTRTAQ